MKSNPPSLHILRQEFSRHSYLKQLFYTYALVSCVLFFLFSSLIIYYINNDYKETQISIQEQNLEQAYRLNQTVLQDIYHMCYTTLEDNELTQILYGSNYSPNLALSARALHDRIRLNSSLIHSVYFVNYRTNTVIDNYGREKTDTHFDTELFSFLETHKPSKTPFYGLPRTIVRNNTYTSIFSIIYHASDKGALVVNIDSQSYTRLLALETNDYLDWVQIDANGKVFASSDSSLFGSDYTENELYLEVTQKQQQKGSFNSTQNASRCLVAFRHNTGLNITYISIFNQNTLYTSNHLLWVILLSGLCFILASMLVTFAVSLLVYRPFRSFKKQLSESSEPSVAPQTAEIDDFTYLSNIYTEIINANKRLQTINHAWLKEKDHNVLKQLLASNTNGCQLLPEQYESLNQYFSKSFYRLILISIDYQSRIQEDINSINLLRYAIANVMNELFDDTVLYMKLDLVSPHVIYFINHDEEDNDALRQLLEKGQTFLQDNFGITLSIGVGEPTSNLDEIAISYSSAQEALSHRFITGNGSLCFSGEFPLTSPREEIYPYETDSAIISAVKSMNSELAAQSVKEFFGQIRLYHLDQVIRSILQLDASLQRLENTAELTHKEFPWDLNVLTQLDIATIQSFFIDRCCQDISELCEIKNHSAEKPELIKELIQLIDNNLYNPNLSVAFLAGEVHLSINYLRSIFKENTGNSLSNYITQKKIDLICYLLTNTDDSIQEISDRLGFSTKNYFFTFFKKHTKMTPNEYRRSHQQNPVADE